MKKIYAVIIIWLITAPFSILLAADLELKAYVDKNRVSVNERFTYSVEITGKSTSLPDINYPDLSAFNILAGPNQSTSIQLVNGKMTSSKTHSFVLSASETGTLTIGPATMKDEDGKTYRTDKISITVEQRQKAPSNQGQTDALKKRKDPKIAGQNLYIKTEVSNRRPYVGEQIIIEYKIYFRVSIRDNAFEQIPKYSGFWNEAFDMPSRPSVKNEIVNGVNYNVATIRKAALFPTRTGEIEIEPLKMNFEILVRSRQRGNNLFDNFFNDPFGRTVRKTVTSKPVTIDVQPLPETGKPPDFNGAVGQFDLDVSLDKTSVKVNEAIALNVTVKGQGNIKLVELPNVKVPVDIEQYDPEVSLNINNKGAGIKGWKKAEYILIPRIEGKYKIEPVSFSYFDPQKEEYRTLTSRPFVLNIRPGAVAGASKSGVRIGSRQEVELLGRDIRFIKENTRFLAIGSKNYTSLTYLLSYILPIFLFVAFVFYNDHSARMQSDTRLARSRKAGKMASRHLAQAKKLLNVEEEYRFYKAIASALQGFVQNRLNIELSDFSVQNVRRTLGEYRIDSGLVEDYVELLQESDFRQYARTDADYEKRREVFERAKSVLTGLEKWIK